MKSADRSFRLLMGAVVFVAAILINLPTYSGLDSDLQAYSLYTEQIASGATLYQNVFEHKPPLYFSLLLPGHLFGGQMGDYFAMHLFYVALFYTLLFFYAISTGSRSMRRGWQAVILFLLVGTLNYFKYGNLNGSIIFPSMILSLLGFIVFERLFLEKKQTRTSPLWTALLLGVLAGAAFMNRLSIGISLLSLLGFIALLVRGEKFVEVLRQGIAWLLGFFAVGILLFSLFGLSFARFYDEVVVFNRLYSQIGSSAGNFAFVTVRAFYRFIVHNPLFDLLAAGILVQLVVSFIAAWKRKEVSSQGLRDFLQRRESWLILWLLSELFVILLQGQGDKGYVWYLLFIPAVLYAVELIERYIAADSPAWFTPRFALITLLVLLALQGGYRTVRIAPQVQRVLAWPEGKMFDRIREGADNRHDLFTLDFMDYVYLETGTLPAIPYDHYWPEKWTYYGHRPEIEVEQWRRLEEAAPKFVVKRVGLEVTPPEAAFLANYEEEGRYKSSFSRARESRELILYQRIAADTDSSATGAASIGD